MAQVQADDTVSVKRETSIQLNRAFIILEHTAGTKHPEFEHLMGEYRVRDRTPILWASVTDEDVAEDKHGFISKGDSHLWFVWMGFDNIGDYTKAFFRSTDAVANPWDATWERNDGDIGTEPKWVPDPMKSPVEMAARAFKNKGAKHQKKKMAGVLEEGEASAPPHAPLPARARPPPPPLPPPPRRPAKTSNASKMSSHLNKLFASGPPPSPSSKKLLEPEQMEEAPGGIKNMLPDRPIIGRGKRRAPKRSPVLASFRPDDPVETNEASPAVVEIKNPIVTSNGASAPPIEIKDFIETDNEASSPATEITERLEKVSEPDMVAERQLPSTEDGEENTNPASAVPVEGQLSNMDQEEGDGTPEPSSVPDNSSNAAATSSPHVVASTAVEKPKVGKLDKSLLLEKKLAPPADTIVTPERQLVLKLSSNKHVSNRVGKFLEFTPEQETDRAAASAASAERFSDKKAVLDSQATEAERAAAEDAAVAAGELTAAEREKRQRKRAAVKKHAEKVALAKKAALEAEAAHLAAEEDIRRRAQVAKELRMMSSEDKAKDEAPDTEVNGAKKKEPRKASTTKPSHVPRSARVSQVMNEVFLIGQVNPGPPPPRAEPASTPLEMSIQEVEEEEEIPPLQQAPEEQLVREDDSSSVNSSVTASLSITASEKVALLSAQEKAALVGGSRKDFRSKLWRDFRDAVGAKVLREGVISDGVFNDVMKRPEQFNLTSEQLATLKKRAPRDSRGSILLQQWCDVAYDDVLEVLNEDDKESTAPQADDDEEKTAQTIDERRQRRASTAKDFYSTAPPPVHKFSTKDMSRAALGLPSGQRQSITKIDNVANGKEKAGQADAHKLAKQRVLATVLSDTPSTGTSTDAIAAVVKGDADAVSSLLAGGVKVNSTNKGGQTLLDLAIQRNQPAVRRVLEKYGAKRSGELAMMARAGQSQEASRSGPSSPSSGAGSQEKVESTKPYFIGWFHDSSSARWASLVQRQFEKELFPQFSGTTLLDFSHKSSIATIASIVIFVSQSFMSTPGLQEILISACDNGIPVVLLWRSSSRIRQIRDIQLLITQNELHLKARQELRNSLLFEYSDHDYVGSLKRLMCYLQESCCATVRFFEMVSLTKQAARHRTSAPTSITSQHQELKHFLEPLKVSKEIFEAIAMNKFDLLNNLMAHVVHANPLLVVYDINRQLTRTMNMLKFAQGRNRQEMIGFLQGEVLRLQTEAAKGQTTVHGRLCYAILSDEPTTVRMILMENPEILSDGNQDSIRAIMAAMARNNQSRKVEAMVEEMAIERRVTQELTHVANIMSRDFVALFHKFDSNRDRKLSSAEVAAGLQHALRHVETRIDYGRPLEEKAVTVAIDNMLGKSRTVDLVSFWAILQRSVLTTKAGCQARNARSWYCNPLATKRHATERKLLQAILEDDATAIETMFLFDDADDQMINPVGQALVDFAKERGKHKAFRSLTLWNRIYATCSRLRQEFRGQLDNRGGSMNTGHLMRTLDRTGNGIVSQEEFLQSAIEIFGIRTAYDARLVFRMIVASSTSRFWEAFDLPLSQLTKRYPPTDTEENPAAPVHPAVKSRGYRNISHFELRAFLKNERDRLASQVIIRPACSFFIVFVYYADENGMLVLRQRPVNGIVELHQLSDGVYHVKICIDLCAALDTVSPSSLLTLGSFAIRKEHGRSSMKVATLDAYGVDIKVDKETLRSFSRDSAIVQGVFSGEKGPSETVGGPQDCILVALPAMSDSNVINLVLPRGKLTLDGVCGELTSPMKQPVSCFCSRTVNTHLSSKVPGKATAIVEDEDSEDEGADDDADDGDSSRAPSTSSARDEGYVQEYPAVESIDDALKIFVRARCNVISRPHHLREMCERGMRTATMLVRAAKQLRISNAAVAKRAQRRPAGATDAFASFTQWQLFDCDICSAENVAELEPSTSVNRSFDLLADEVNGNAEYNSIPIPLQARGVNYSSITAVSTFTPSSNLALENLIYAPRDEASLDVPLRYRIGSGVKMFAIRNANTVAMVRATLNRQRRQKSFGKAADMNLRAVGIQVKIGHVVRTSDRMRLEALGVSMCHSVDAAVHLLESTNAPSEANVVVLLSIIPDPTRVPNIYNFGPKNVRFHLDGAAIAETAIEIVPGPEDLLAEAYEFINALTGEPVTKATVTVVVNEQEGVFTSGDDHGVELPLDLPEGEAKCSISVQGYLRRRYTRIRYRKVPGSAAHSLRVFCMLPSRAINSRLLTDCGRDKSSVYGAAVHLVLHCSVNAQLDIHVRTSEDEHIYYSNSTSADQGVVLTSPSKEDGASVLSMLPRRGVGYKVWAYAYSSCTDIFSVGAVAELYVSHKVGDAIETRDVELRLPSKHVVRQPRFWEIFSIDTDGRISVANKAQHSGVFDE